MTYPSNDALESLLASGAHLFGQGDRLLRLRLAEGAGIAPDALLPHRVTGDEALSKSYRYRVDCLSADAYLELKDLLGASLELAILLPDGGQRLLTGLITRAEQNGTDGGFAQYTLTIEPALATLTNLSVGGKWLARVSDSFSLFVHRLGMKLIAAGGHIDIQAQDGEIRISSSQKITLTSNTEIVLQAPKVTAIAQGARIDMGGGAITTQCSGKHEQKAARHELNGPGGGSPVGAFNPTTAEYDQKIVLRWMGTEEPIQNRRYRLKLEDGRVVEGVTDDRGHTEQVQTEIGFSRYRVELLPEN